MKSPQAQNFARIQAYVKQATKRIGFKLQVLEWLSTSRLKSDQTLGWLRCLVSNGLSCSNPFYIITCAPLYFTVLGEWRFLLFLSTVWMDAWTGWMVGWISRVYFHLLGCCVLGRVWMQASANVWMEWNWSRSCLLGINDHYFLSLNVVFIYCW